MLRRVVLAGLAATLASPAALIQPAAAAILFTCDSVTGSATFSPGLVHGERPQSLSSGPTAPAGPAPTTVVSTSDTGVKGNSGSFIPRLSADGSRVAFSSTASNFDPADTDAGYDVYAKDPTTGDIMLASSSDAGVDGNNDSSSVSSAVSLSADGTKVAFASTATNLDPGDTDSMSDVYVKDLVTGDIILASTSDGGAKGNDESAEFIGVSLSADGTKVAFASGATNLDPGDTDVTLDVYVKDLSTGDVTLASTSDGGTKGNANSGVQAAPALSADGTKVAFASGATNLDPGDTDVTLDVYVKDLSTGDVTLASTSDTGVKSNSVSFPRSMSGDGSKVAIISNAGNLDPADPPDATADVYVKDLGTGDIVLASVSDTGVNGNGGGSNAAWLSDDGAKVAFDTRATNLDPADTDGFGDVDVKNLASGDLTLASASGNGVKGNDDSGGILGPSLSADGTEAAFNSFSTNLDPADTDGISDIYVKRLPAIPTSIAIGDCSNGNSGTASVVDAHSYGSRPLGCPEFLGGAAGNDYADTTPVLLGANPSLHVDWATGPDSFGVAKLKMSENGTQWRAVLAIQASPGHTTPATNQYLPASGSGFTKTKLKGRIDWSALDSFNCMSGTVDPLSWLDLLNNGSFIVKNA